MLRSGRLFNTISFRLAALCAVLFAVILAVLLVFTYFTTSHALEDQLRARVKDEFTTFSEEVDSEGADAVVKEIDERIVKPTAPGSYFFVADSSGHKLIGNLDAVPVIPGWQKLSASAAGRPAAETAHEVWGQGKIFPGGIFIFVGQDAYRVVTAQRSLVLAYVWSGLLAGLMSLLAGLVLSRGFLHRIDDINKTSLAIMQGHLKERIPLRGTSDEIDRLSGNLNRLFDSNQALLESLKQVTTNIAHDLRTPLSRLRNRLEEAHTGASSVDDLRGEIGAAIAESDQLLATFAALLRIAQIESGSRKKAFARVNLSELGERVASIYGAVAEDDGKKLGAEITSGVFCTGDAELLLQLIVNLVENAIRHTPKGTGIVLRIASPATIEVADNGPGIPAAQRSKVMERFFRLEQSRTTPGSGLGLALVSAIATLHDTKVDLRDNRPGLKVRVALQPV
ncbi:MAG: HAMP domain-containing histidine kinase [Alphaproteobacteria bacterium]|nr:HAMP domain-containing histidine kinase [Alphaproteobacteria bacterium]